MQRFRKGKKGMQALAPLLIFSLLIAGFSANSMISEAAAKGKKTVAIETVSLKIGKKKVTKKTYKMKPREMKKLNVSVSPKKGEKTIRFTSSNKNVVTVNKSGRITAKKTGSAKINVTVTAGKKGTTVSVKQTTWVKIKVVKAATTGQPADQSPSVTPALDRPTPDGTTPTPDKSAPDGSTPTPFITPKPVITTSPTITPDPTVTPEPDDSKNDVVQEVERVFDFNTKTVTLNSGYKMPLNGIGTYSLLGDTCVSSVSEALKRGVRLIDTAYMYSNEKEVGEAVRNSGIPREEIFVITKLYPNQFSEPEKAIEQALEKLDIGYIDMMLLHHPGTNDVKAYKAIEKAVGDGKIRSIGLSNWYVKELETFLPQVTITPALVQNEIHPYYQENDVIPYIQSLGIVVQGWYPLGGRGHTAELLADETISDIAKAHGKSAAQIILRWNLQKSVVVIPGSSNPVHIQENTELYDFELTEEEMEKINALDRGEKHDWY